MGKNDPDMYYTWNGLLGFGLAPCLLGLGEGFEHVCQNLDSIRDGLWRDILLWAVRESFVTGNE